MTTTHRAGDATIALLAAAGLSAEARILPRPIAIRHPTALPPDRLARIGEAAQPGRTAKTF